MGDFGVHRGPRPGFHGSTHQLWATCPTTGLRKPLSGPVRSLNLYFLEEVGLSWFQNRSFRD